MSDNKNVEYVDRKDAPDYSKGLTKAINKIILEDYEQTTKDKKE